MLPQLLANGLVQGALIALLAVGFSIVYTASRFFAFSYGVSVVLAAYSFYFVSQALPLFAAAILATLVGVTVGLSLELGIYRKIRVRRHAPLVLMLASIGAYVIAQNLVSVTFGDSTRLIHAWSGSSNYSWLGVRLSWTRILIAAISFLAIALTSAFMGWSSLGAKFRAIASNRQLASVVGIEVHSIVAVGVALGSAIGALAGILISLDLGIMPTMGFQALLLAVVATVVGGVGSISGAVLAGITLGLLQQLAVWRLPTQWQDAVVFAALVVVLVVRPQGLLGKAFGKTGP